MRMRMARWTFRLSLEELRKPPWKVTSAWLPCREGPSF